VSPWVRNLRVLAAHHLQTVRILESDASGPGRVHLAETPSGNPTATIDGIFLHSRYDPSRDAAMHVEREIDSSVTALIVLGFGLGYGTESARARFPNLPILVIEPDVEVFRVALTARDLSVLFSDRKILLHVGSSPESVTPLLESLPLSKPGFLRLRPAIENNPAAYHAAEEVVRSWLLRKDINVNTLNRFGRLWVRNLARNMRSFLECPGVAPLSGRFDGIPALVIAGGPSLDAIAPRLRELSKRLLIVSVNTPLMACLKAGVEPDFTVVVDPQYWASRYLDWTTSTRGVFVVEPSTNPRVFRRPGASFFLCSSLFPLGEILEAAVGEKGQLGAGGSVATSAWDLARLLGANPVYTAGLDLGFPGMRTHCKGVYVEELWLSGSSRLAPMEGSSFRSLHDIGLFTVRSASGGATPTDRRMLLYKWWFENQLLIRSEMKSFTLSPRGAAIPGMPLAGVEDALALPVIRPEIDRLMAEVRGMRADQETHARLARSLTMALEQLTSELERLQRLSLRGLSLTRTLEKLIAENGDFGSCLRELDDVDRKILEVSARNIAGFLIQSIIHGISGEGERKSNPEEIVARSAAIYEGIAGSAKWQMHLLSRAKDSLEGNDGHFP
jgi:hypothetical protein